MSDYDNTNRGVLFKNDRKSEGDKKPEYTGSLNVDGTEFFLDVWVKNSKTGSKFMSVSVKRKDNQTQQKAPRPAPPPAPKPAPPPAAYGFDDMDSDIPF